MRVRNLRLLEQEIEVRKLAERKVAISHDRKGWPFVRNRTNAPALERLQHSKHGGGQKKISPGIEEEFLSQLFTPNGRQFLGRRVCEVMADQRRHAVISSGCDEPG